MKETLAILGAGRVGRSLGKRFRDFKVVEAHRRALQGLPEELGSAYDAINKLAARVLAEDSAALLARLAGLSAGAKSGAASAGGKA